MVNADVSEAGVWEESDLWKMAAKDKYTEFRLPNAKCLFKHNHYHFRVSY